MKVYKHTITLTFLSEEDWTQRINDEGWALSEIAEEITTGDCIGDWSLDKVEQVEAGNLFDELVAIGNDGTFFDSVYSEENNV